MDKLWTDEAWEEFQQIIQDRRMLKRILVLIKDIDRNGYIGIGKPEPLKWDWTGYWSRRIDDDNRIVYKLEDGVIRIAQCGSHYGDKWAVR